MMKVFVAGASGAVGRRMVPRLLAAGHGVVAMTRDRAKAESLERAGADAVVCDVFDGPGLTAAVRSAAPSAIIHQLTDLPAAMNPRRLKTIYERNNRVRREGTANLIAAARAAGGRIVVGRAERINLIGGGTQILHRSPEERAVGEDGDGRGTMLAIERGLMGRIQIFPDAPRRRGAALQLGNDRYRGPPKG